MLHIVVFYFIVKRKKWRRVNAAPLSCFFFSSHDIEINVAISDSYHYCQYFYHRWWSVWDSRGRFGDRSKECEKKEREIFEGSLREARAHSFIRRILLVFHASKMMTLSNTVPQPLLNMLLLSSHHPTVFLAVLKEENLWEHLVILLSCLSIKLSIMEISHFLRHKALLSHTPSVGISPPT